MKGNIAIFVVLGFVAVAAIGFAVYKQSLQTEFLNSVYKMFPAGNMASPSPSPIYQSLSEDPKYQEVKDKYNLSEEQLQILSTVNPNDND